MRPFILAAAFLATVQAQSGPVDPSTTKDCTFYWDAVDGDTCAKIEDDWGISHAQFVQWVRYLRDVLHKTPTNLLEPLRQARLQRHQGRQRLLR